VLNQHPIATATLYFWIVKAEHSEALIETCYWPIRLLYSTHGLRLLRGMVCCWETWTIKSFVQQQKVVCVGSTHIRLSQQLLPALDSCTTVVYSLLGQLKHRPEWGEEAFFCDWLGTK